MKEKKTKILISVIAAFVVLASVGLAIVLGQGSGDLMDVAAKRDGRPDPNVTYIKPDLTALTADFVGSVETQAASKLAFDQINVKRANAGLSEYVWDSGLEEAAKVRAIEASQLWSHTRPNGTDYWTVNEAIVYGENLAKGYQTAEEAVQAWENSPTHKQNMMDKELITSAICIHLSSNGQWFWANEFGY